MNSLAQDTIQAIRDAEASAAQKEKDARENADQIVLQAKSDAAELIQSRTNAMKAETRTALSQAGVQNEALLKTAQKEAQEEIEKLQQQVTQKSTHAVDTVIKLLVS